MTRARSYLALIAAVLAAPAVTAQEPPKPGPEHDVLKKLVGTWTLTMKFGDMETKGTAVHKMELGGLWLVSDVESEIFGAKFHGKGLDTYDAAKKKYVGYWFDSMSTGSLALEGDYDKEKKTMTLTGTGPGMDGKPTKYRSTSVMPDNDTINFSMWVGDGKDPAFTILYKRKK